MARLLPLLLILVGLVGGIAAGLALRPEPLREAAARPAAARPGVFVEMGSHFVVPLLGAERIRALVVVSLTLEVDPAVSDLVSSREPRLRDAFLQVLFEHANAGGFDGAFTAASPMEALRQSLTEAARGVLGPDVQDVLIVDLMRQDN